MTIGIYFLYACFVVHCLQTVARQWSAAGEFGISINGRLLWVAAILLAFITTLALSIPKSAIYLPMPFALGLFVPSIAAGRHIVRKLEVLGTSRTENIEKVASNTMWVGIFGVALNLLFWAIGIAGYLMSQKH